MNLAFAFSDQIIWRIKFDFLIPGCKHVVLWRTVGCSGSGEVESPQEGGIEGSSVGGL